MTNERWALFATVGTYIVMRVMDTILPKGYISKYVNKYLIKKPPEEK